MQNSDLNLRKGISVTNVLAVPVVQCRFNILNWKITLIKRTDFKMRKPLSCHHINHLNADVDCLYVPRSNGDRKLVQQELSNKSKTISLQ